MKSRVFLIPLILVVFYSGAYIWYRETQREISPQNGLYSVIFPPNRVAYYLFRPASYVDLLFNNVGAHLGPHVVAQDDSPTSFTVTDAKGKIRTFDIEPFRTFVMQTESGEDISADPTLFPFVSAYFVPEFNLLEVHIASLELSGAQNALGYVIWSDLKGRNKRIVNFEEGTGIGAPLVISPSKKFFYSKTSWHMSAGFSVQSVGIGSIEDNDETMSIEEILGPEAIKSEHIARQVHSPAWLRDSVLAVSVSYVHDENMQVVYRTETWEIDLDIPTATMIDSKDYPGGFDR